MRLPNFFSVPARALLLAGICLAALTATESAPAAEPLDIPSLTWEQRSDWHNVKSDGAVGDGKADDTAAIQKAFDTAIDGSTIYFPAGSYRLTRTVGLKGPLHGFSLIGHGRDTQLIWDGEAGGKMLRVDGIALSRYVGFVFKGQGKAAIGLDHENNNRFVTEVRHQHLAFHDFTDAGIFADPNDAFALAETTFENCLFSRCKRGISFTQFNDYNYTFDGCEFRDCGTAINSAHGGFYVRNSHFSGSSVADIHASPEHPCSVRRCTSEGSNLFIKSINPVSGMTIQDCHVAGWKNAPGAIVVGGAPVMIFDCSFNQPPGNDAPVHAQDGHSLIVSGNVVQDSRPLLPDTHKTGLYTVPAGTRSGSLTSASTRFLVGAVRSPGKLFDAKRDFAATGDGVSDDTAALQQTIDAARAQGANALAYLPTGTYVVTSTLHLTGADFRVGGSGWCTRLLWKGAAGGTMIDVVAPQDLTLEYLNVGSHDVGAMNNGIDILQVGSEQPSRMTYDGVTVFGMYQKQPLHKGLHFSKLGSGEVVHIRMAQGNMRFSDSAAATVLNDCSYEGSIVVDGKMPARGGFLGIQTRLTTNAPYALFVRDNHSIVISDFYIENTDNGYSLEGSLEGAPDLPPGRVTIQGTKIHCKTGPAETTGVALKISNYAGQVFYGPNQFYIEPKLMRTERTGTQPISIHLIGNIFYGTKLEHVDDATTSWYRIGNHAVDSPDKPTDALPPKGLSALTPMCDDMRRLGELDLTINHPEALRQPTK